MHRGNFASKEWRRGFALVPSKPYNFSMQTQVQTRCTSSSSSSSQSPPPSYAKGQLQKSTKLRALATAPSPQRPTSSQSSSSSLPSSSSSSPSILPSPNSSSPIPRLLRRSMSATSDRASPDATFDPILNTGGGGNTITPHGASSASTSVVNVLVFNPDGTYSAAHTTKERIIKEARIAARDYVTLSSGFSRLPKPALLVRDQCIIVSVSFLRALIQKDRVILFHPDQAEVRRFAPTFAQYLHSVVPHSQEQSNIDAEPAFELRALEGILETVAHRYARRTSLLAPLVDGVLRKLACSPILQSFDAIHDNLLPMKDNLSQFEIEATLIRNVLAETLRNNEDMLHMLLTERARLNGQLPPMEAHMEVELLLETYLSMFIDVAQQAYYLRKRVESNQSIFELKLDSHRNRMMHLNLQLSMMSVGLAWCTVMFGMFGMNLTSGFETSQTILPFWGVSFAAMTLAFGVYRFLDGSLRADPTLGILSRDRNWWLLGGAAASPQRNDAQNDVKSPTGNINTIFNRLDEIEMVLAHDRLTKREFADAVSALKVPREAAEFLWNALDTNHDGKLSEDEQPRGRAAAAANAKNNGR